MTFVLAIASPLAFLLDVPIDNLASLVGDRGFIPA